MKFSDFPQFIFIPSTINDGNMSTLRGDKKQSRKNREVFLKKCGIDPKDTLLIATPHGSSITTVYSKDKGKGIVTNDVIEVDGAITNEKHLFLFLLTADCLPIGIVDPKTESIGLLHGSWKSLDENIIDNTIYAMQKEFKTDPKNLVVKFGPSIGPCCYRKIAHINQKQNWGKYIQKDNDETFIIDIWGFAEKKLLQKGVKKENIHNQLICSYHSSNYFSHRKYILKKLSYDFRFATVFGMKK